MITESQIEKALKDLGETSEDVAKNLLAKGCRGLKNNCDSCPVAYYLRGLFGNFSGKLAVGGYTIGYGEDGRKTMDIPKPVRSFIYEFDRNKYQELEA